ncbi:TPA: hypothetical protein N0F65_012146 [Lagenidium giganteum]|uniref:Rab-GAP TBC domain-containing protein n=1 Tax=Lagenidium giganteum TaxID=4803 RepID=A0AAV2YXH3_9STRA|nr:TPA: hypothetical protein N0F65_012146 [Lagenidium giganteum]
MERRPPQRQVHGEKNAEVAQRWIEMVLGEKFVEDFPFVLQDGEKLCELANRLYKALGMKQRSCTIFKPPEHESGEQYAAANLHEYLRACSYLGVPPEDCFHPDDLIHLQNVDQVYRNLAALQAVAVSISNRRSIDERLSLAPSLTRSTPEAASPFARLRISSPDASAFGVFQDDEDLGVADESPGVAEAQYNAWSRLLTDYEQQQLAKAEEDRRHGPDMEGMGKLAHNIWMTEERIRSLLLREDRSFGVVPRDLHGKLWMLTSGAELEMRRQGGLYQRLLAMEEEDTEATRQIDADLHRTVCDADKPEWSEEKTAMMRRVLVAYSYHNPTLGYCQGLNYIASRLLQYTGEEESFFLLMKMVQLMPDDYYTTMLGLAVDQHVFADLVRLQTPDIADHLNELGGSGMELSLACTEWFLTLFASPCDREITSRIWDTIFLMGDEVLFRVALALMQQERQILLKCNSYGDMLKHLNEIGRENIDAHELMRETREQDSVLQNRVEDFRAHHRLQLASGIAISSLEGDDGDQNRPSGSTKTGTPKKSLNQKKKQGLFKHYDMHAGRACRTFDRYITDEYAASLQREHPNFSCFYDGVQPTIIEDYWTCGDSFSQWGIKDLRVVGSPATAAELDRRRLQSDATSARSNERFGVDEVETQGTGSLSSGIRERRSKSTAFINSKKNTNQRNPNTHHRRNRSGDGDNDVGRSPVSWIQRLEGWHKDMKKQKERRKAEKLRQKLGRRSENALVTSSEQHPPLPVRVRKSLSSSPKSKLGGDSFRGHSFDFARNRKGEIDDGGRSQLDGVSSSRSAHEIGSRALAELPSMPLSDHLHEHRPLAGEIELPTKRVLDPWIEKTDVGGDELVITKVDDTEERPSQRSERTTETSSTFTSTHSFSTPSLQALDRPEDPKTRSFELAQKPPRHAPLPAAALYGLLFSPEVTRSHIATFHDADDDELLDSLAQPRVRRNLSLPLADNHPNQPPRFHRRVNRVRIENARIIRDRAQVVSYLQRKASDASSMTGSVHRSPRADTPVGRASVSSSGSSQISDQNALSGRSAARGGPFRKSSFSFFEKLSVDLENCVDDLNSSNEEKPPPPSLLMSSSSTASGGIVSQAMSATASPVTMSNGTNGWAAPLSASPPRPPPSSHSSGDDGRRGDSSGKRRINM